MAALETSFKPLPSWPTTGSVGIVGLCSCLARVCNGVGLVEVRAVGTAALVVVVVEGEVVDEVEFGGRECVGMGGGKCEREVETLVSLAEVRNSMGGCWVRNQLELKDKT